MSASIEVKVYGQTLRLEGDDPAKLARVAEFLDSKMNDVLGPPSQGLSTKGAMLAALNVAEEWFTTKREQERILKDLGGRVDELISLLPE